MTTDHTEILPMPVIQKRLNVFAKKEKFSGKFSSGSFGSASSLEEIYGGKKFTVKR
jgi:hypothetical protein